MVSLVDFQLHLHSQNTTWTGVLVEATNLGLNDYYQTIIINYMRFARYQRSQSLRAIIAYAADVKDTRLLEETYTLDEISDIIEYLSSSIKSEVESELINSAHTNALLLQQLFTQAQQWHLKLEVDTSELENRDLLAQIKSFEEEQCVGGPKEKLSSPIKTKLEPLIDSGSSLLQAEISRLKEENDTLKKRVKLLESQVTAVLQEKSKLNDLVIKLQKDISSTSIEKDSNKLSSETELISLQDRLAHLQTQLENQNVLVNNQETLENDLIATNKKFLEVKEQLEMAEKELEKKFSETSAYINMKKMLNKKNEQIKELRKKLAELNLDTKEEEFD